ncbi:MAG: hypothetical protein HY680_10800 [Chloroflexi bacterium]|nr:hypothetical protein [Chloroflexota bacterium]
MELTSDLLRAQVIIIYISRLQVALYLDRRAEEDDAPLARLVPQQELLLEGREVAYPLTTAAVAEIERRQFRSPDPVMFNAYFAQLKEHLEARIKEERPQWPAPEFVCLAPHAAPILVLAHNRPFNRLLQQVADQGHPGFLQEVKEQIKRLYVFELTRPESIRHQNVERLTRDLPFGEEWAIFAAPER